MFLIAKLYWPRNPWMEMVSLTIIFNCGGAGSKGLYIINLTKKCQIVLQMAAPIYIYPLSPHSLLTLGII